MGTSGPFSISLYLPGEPIPSRIEIEQVLHAALAENGDYFAAYGGLEYRLEALEPDARPFGHRRMKVRTEFSIPGDRPWEPWVSCPSCGASGRMGFSGRLPCDLCVDGLRSFRLPVGSCRVIVYTESERAQPTRWSCRVVSPRPVALSVGRWLGWLESDGEFLAERADDPSSLADAIGFAEDVADELEQHSLDLE